jgi:TM2 domain-containing membrane protein YozV
MRRALFVFFLFLVGFYARSCVPTDFFMIPNNETVVESTAPGSFACAHDLERLLMAESTWCSEFADESMKPHPIFSFLREKKKSSRKLTAAFLAFPFPFGIVGLHRIFLGTAPYVPVVYIATAGGVFGLLPLIDFIMIVAEKDMARFMGNRQVFMWVE